MYAPLPSALPALVISKSSKQSEPSPALSASPELIKSPSRCSKRKRDSSITDYFKRIHHRHDLGLAATQESEIPATQKSLCSCAHANFIPNSPGSITQASQKTKRSTCPDDGTKNSCDQSRKKNRPVNFKSFFRASGDIEDPIEFTPTPHSPFDPIESTPSPSPSPFDPIDTPSPLSFDRIENLSTPPVSLLTSQAQSISPPLI